MNDISSTLANLVISVVQTGGYLGVAGLTLLENLFPPIPSELILPVAGFLVSSGQFAFVWVVVAATLGSLGGALILYALGYRMGEERLRTFVKRHGRWMALSESDVGKSKEWFDRHGGKAVFIGRLVPTVRSVISIPAGLDRIPLWRFVLYTTLGSALWNAILVGVGWWLGGQWEQIKPYLNILEWGVLILIAAAVGWFIWKRKRG